jgi:YidC/Oxa1 family membrane protein insertase
MLLSANVFQPLINVFQWIIELFHNDVGLSWGLAIVMLTVCVRIVILPLTIKQFQSMRRMQSHQPELKALQQKYKDDKQLQQQKMMEFYRENNVNPMASCLPMVVQLPVFMALYYMLRQSLRDDVCHGVQAKAQATYAAAHHISLAAAHIQTVACSTYGHYPAASFLFIKDITATPTGLTLIALLVLYAGTTMASTLLMAQPGMQGSQKWMMVLMPLVFVFFIVRFPAGLMVYWITTNLWTMGQGLFMRRGATAPPSPPVATAGAGAGGGTASGDGSTGATAGSQRGGGLMGMLSRISESAQQQRPTADTSTRGGRTTPARSARRGASGATKAPVAAKRGNSVPPPPPRKKKKRSGRRR